MPDLGKLRTEGTKTTVYGHFNDGVFVEDFATNPYGCGASENLAGTLHPVEGTQGITLAERNAAFLFCAEDELDEQDRGATLDQLRTRYPVEY